MPDNLIQQIQELLASPFMRQALPYLAGVAALLVLLVIVKRILRWLGRPQRSSMVDPSLVIDVSGLAAPAGESALRLSVYHVPVRLAGVVIAPLGRDAESPAAAGVPRLLNAAVPGLGDVVAHDRPLARVWPRQLSATGFAHSFARHVSLPGDKGKGSPWCLVAGRISVGNQSYAVGLVLAAAAPNNLSLISVESDHQWLDVLRIRVA